MIRIFQERTFFYDDFPMALVFGAGRFVVSFYLLAEIRRQPPHSNVQHRTVSALPNDVGE
ncbi:MAG: hypothetical protein ABIT35_12625 [Chitinophagaceae bacterium]